MLQLTQISKGYGGRLLFQDMNLRLLKGDCMGLVGPNGTGKSTLFSIILGHETPDTGEVLVQKGCLVGHLPQETAPVGDATVLQVALAGHALSSKGLSNGKGGGLDSTDIDLNLVEKEAFTKEAKAKKILSGLSFKEEDLEKPARTMSGGWVMRAHLARLLVAEPDILMLDEPTNHLDLESLLWLQDYLGGYKGALLMVSHDRAFLNKLVTSILEIERSKVNQFTGNYDEYLIQKKADQEQVEAAYKNQQKEIARLMKFVDRFRAKSSKATQAQSKLKQIERMDKIDAPDSGLATLAFTFPQPMRSGQKVFQLKNASQSYGDKQVYSNLDFELERGQRVVFVGPNGAGKSTLLKILAGVLPIQSGERIPGHNVQVGYFSQNRTDTLDISNTVLEEILSVPISMTEERARTLLGSFLFSGDDVFKRVNVLSGGEKSRLALLKMLLDPPNLLLLDEPTTHLDIPSIDALLEALEPFEGTVVFISHDVHFIRNFATHVVHVENGSVRHYPGDYDYYLFKRGEEEKAVLKRNNLTATTEKESVRSKDQVKEKRRQEAEARQRKYKLKQTLEKKFTDIEHRIQILEKEEAALLAELEEEETYKKGNRVTEINMRMRAIHELLPALHQEWESIGLELSELTPS